MTTNQGLALILFLILLLLLYHMMKADDVPREALVAPNFPPAKTPDELALQVQSLWKQTFPDATLMPGIGKFSENKQGWMLLTHTPKTRNHGAGSMAIGGLNCLSPLCMNALYSSEYRDGQWLNLYEIMIPEYPTNSAALSNVQIYVQALQQEGLNISGLHTHWNNTDRFVVAIHHQNIGLPPLEFSKRTIRALQAVQQW